MNIKKQEKFLGIPYNWQWPSWKEINKRIWNKSDHRLFPPKAFGWGYTINLYELLHHRKKLLIILLILVALFSIYAIKRNQELENAHSTFDNYYVFRGCAKLLKRTSDYGLCKTKDGDTIKIVKFHNEWYLDGDLPVRMGGICL